MLKSAVMGGEGDRFRYELRRIWNASAHPLVVVMLNPSTADHEQDDNTIRRLIHFANAWGYGSLLVANLFALRTPHPSVLLDVIDRFGDDNASYIDAAMKVAAFTSGKLLVAWGNDGDLDDRAEWFANRALNAHGLTLLCLGRTLNGSPKHPMARGRHRIPDDQLPLIWRALDHA